MAKYAPGLSRHNPGIPYMENVQNHCEKHNGPMLNLIKFGQQDNILMPKLKLVISTLSAVKSNVFFEKFKVKSNGKKSEVQRVLDFTFFTVGLHFLLK